MNEFKGTKGKWEIIGEPFLDEEGKYGYHGQFDIKSGKTTAAVVNAYNFFNIEFEEAKANAQLISKAPEMLDFINRISGEMLRNDFVLDERWYEQARQLIKEATEI